MWTACSPPFSAIQRSAAADLIPWCEAHGTGVIVYSPMQSGLLSGGFSEARAASLPADDWRSRHAEFRAPALQRNLALAQAFRPVAERHGRRPPPRVAWTLAWQGVTGAIVARNAAQVDACALPNSSWMMRIWRARRCDRADGRGPGAVASVGRPASALPDDLFS